MADLTIDQLRALAQSTGFPDPDTAAAVAMAESQGNVGSLNDTRGRSDLPKGTTNELSNGLWQINTLAHPQYEPAALRSSPAYNARAAFDVSKGGKDFSPWSTYTSGAYKKYLPKAQASDAQTPSNAQAPGTQAAASDPAAPPAASASFNDQVVRQQAGDLAESGDLTPEQAASVSGQPTPPSLGGPTRTALLRSNPEAQALIRQGVAQSIPPTAASAPTPGMIPYPREADRTAVDFLSKQADAQTEATRNATGALDQFSETFKNQQQQDAIKLEAEQTRHAERLAREAETRKNIELEYKDSQTKIAKQITDLSAQGVDPDHYFHKLGTAGTILSAIAMAAGAFGAHPLGPHGSGSQNYAAEIINGAISRDVEAQRENLRKNLSVLEKRMELGKDKFDSNLAMLKAERDSNESGTQVALHMIDRQMAMHQQNAQVQQQLLATKQQVISSNADRVTKLNQDIFNIQKPAEERIPEKAFKYEQIAAAGGRNLTPEQAQARAIKSETGVDLAGQPNVDISKKEKAGAPNAKAQAQLNSLDNAIGAIQRIEGLRELHAGGSALPFIGDEDRARGDAEANAALAEIGTGFGGRFSSAELNALKASIPEHPLHGQFSLGDPNGAKLAETKKRLILERAKLAAELSGKPMTTPAAVGGTPVQ